MTPRDRAKRAQDAILRASANPFLPSDAKAALGEVSILLGEWAIFLERLERMIDGDRD